MRRQCLPIEQLQAWAKVNSVKFHNTKIERILGSDPEEDRGSGLVATGDFEAQQNFETLLLSVPQELVLSRELVEQFAKYDRHLRDVLEALGAFGRVGTRHSVASRSVVGLLIKLLHQSTRGAILTFLLLQITNSSPDLPRDAVGITNPLTDYVKFLPKEFPLPTFYSEEERELLEGTSLKAALDQKLRSLEREFELLRTSTLEISWCSKHWWDDETGYLTFYDWKLVDAMFRSRALELAGTGNAMVPCVDMANHASGDQTVALYETDERRNAVLQLRQGRTLRQGEEITITYGDEKGASEMIFSYGFLEVGLTDARQLFLDLDIPTDDPLRMAKKAVCKEAPGVRIYLDEYGRIGWESNFLWWACINEEDGLEFRLLQTNDGDRELSVQWKGEELEPSAIGKILSSENEPCRDIFELRAVVTLQERIERQALELENSETQFEDGIHQSEVRLDTWSVIQRLRSFELDLLAEAYTSLQARVCFHPTDIRSRGRWLIRITRRNQHCPNQARYKDSSRLQSLQIPRLQGRRTFLDWAGGASRPISARHLASLARTRVGVCQVLTLRSRADAGGGWISLGERKYTVWVLIG